MIVLPPRFADWFAARGWHLRAHQRAVLQAVQDQHHALLIAPTGGGKTLAGFLSSLIELTDTPTDHLHTLYISPRGIGQRETMQTVGAEQKHLAATGK